MKMPLMETKVAADLQVSKSQAAAWLQRLVKEGMLKKLNKPVRYVSKSQPSLFE
jgi:predicted transcriptional regulator